MTQAKLFPSVLSPILLDRRLSSIISGVALLQVGLALFHVPGWQCPLFNALGIPCPGCGMTRATLFLVHGEWKQALLMHAFAPALIFGLALITVSAIAPKPLVRRLAGRTETVERYTGLTTLLLTGLVLYWLARLLIFQSAFIRLIER